MLFAPALAVKIMIQVDLYGIWWSDENTAEIYSIHCQIWGRCIKCAADLIIPHLIKARIRIIPYSSTFISQAVKLRYLFQYIRLNIRLIIQDLSIHDFMYIGFSYKCIGSFILRSHDIRRLSSQKNTNLIALLSIRRTDSNVSSR